MNQYLYNLGQKFEALTEESGDSIAIRFLDGSNTTYSELNHLSGKIAHWMIKMGIKHGDVVAIFNIKTSQSYAVMLACLKIGATYTNLDYNSPTERLRRMISLCKPVLFFTDKKFLPRIDETGFDSAKVFVINTDVFIEQVSLCDSSLPEINIQVNGGTPAYLMFTSGSTGFPKGVVITHANILNFIDWTRITYETKQGDIFTNINPMHFDNSVFDFYASLFTGASLVPVTEDLTKNPRRMLDALNKVGPTVWFSVPSMLVFVLKLRALKESDLADLRIVTFGGEGFPKNQLRNLWNYWKNRVKFINVYGPTECTCICSSYTVTEKDIQSDDLLPLGPIAPNFDFLIIDEYLKPVGAGQTGELCISGPNVGFGYFNNPEKTREAFIQNPINESHRDIIYRSGDLVRYGAAENLLYFCGRRDNQIKRMGYRIELEEIENALSSLSYVEENAVIYLKGDDDNGRIIACLRLRSHDDKSILSDLAKLLPAYMMPNEIKLYEHLPKNQNGKIDRLKLQEEYSL